ncbi:Glycosyl transferase family 2 [Geosmithia morbida]|uniref:Glycosyl transferase family 2 n=1 Tax=Geosmithia morbida TaxID=1094350 RepID=A0A9P4YQN8_9HYPO|nr:Glycosyl transferase family 2 [Geosmithia morbida]KAF4119264.1 Glycosyl transferase family 2 [Geosmithia morbida]
MPDQMIPDMQTPSLRTSSTDPGCSQAIEQLYGLKLGDVKPLPKVTIIGDKSCGKTSIFEALTGLSLPASRHLLSNFAIHAQFKRTTDQDPTVKAHIRPGPLKSQDKAVLRHLESFQVANNGPLTGDDFTDILEKAANRMCIAIVDRDAGGDHEQVGNQQHLSDNVLVVEISGPDVNSLSVVDFPGFMHNSALLDAREIQAVKSLVMSCIEEPQSIILAVVDATNQIENQVALEFARAVDPEGDRTIGVLTKCDIVQRGDENRVLRLTRNKEHHLAQGWFALKNLSTQERRDGLGFDRRNVVEGDFFSQPPWNEIDRSRAGIKSLKEFLGDRANGMLQENVNLLLEKIQILTESSSASTGLNAGSVGLTPIQTGLNSSGTGLTSVRARFADSTVTVDEKRERLRTVIEFPSEADPPSSEKHGTDLEAGSIKKRPTMLINACTVGLTIALVLTLVGLGCRQLAQEIATDGDWYRLFLLVTTPLQIFVSLFFCQAIICSIAQLLGPVSQVNANSKFFSAKAVKRLNVMDGPLPHVTIQCPVYKEGLEAVIEPTVKSLEAAIRNYESHGGTAGIFMNDDGMQLLSPEEAAERKAYYAAHNIGWVARPKHNPKGEGLGRFIRRGKFKKASNMNYALGVSLKVEDKLATVDRSGVWTQAEEEEAYQRCLGEVLDEELGRAWAGGNIRVGDYILIIDSDTRVPVECMIDAVSELEESPQVAILQFSSGVMNVTTGYFEMGITFFTNLIYTAIRYAVANGDVSPFVGHNAFLRWSALQEVSFESEGSRHGDPDLAPGEKDPNSTTPYEKFWSESHVSEDFDISLRLQTMGYHIRLGSYCGDDFKEGVSLTVYDELARWEKYAYGCNELLFHPVRLWWRRGPFTPLFLRFILSSMPIGSKVSIMAYVGTYYAIGFAWIGSLLNYFLIGWANGHLDHYYMNSWRVWVALIVVFSGAGNLALAVVRYRSENTTLLGQVWTCFRWAPLLFVFLGGISVHVCQAILCHMFSIDMSWGATAKEVSDTSFFIEMPMIARRFKFVFVFCICMTGLMICGACAFPYLWRIDQLIAIFPLGCVVFSHFFLPVLLNPALMKFTW